MHHDKMLELKKEINANEQQMRLIQAKIEDLLTKPQNKATQIRLVRLNKERAKIRRILEEEKSKLAENTDTLQEYQKDHLEKVKIIMNLL